MPRSIWDVEDRVQAPNALDLEARGDALMNRGDAQGALLAFTEAIQLAPEMWRLCAKAGSAHMALNQPEAAVAAFVRARAIMPQSPAVLANLGAALSVLKRYDAAVAVLREAVALRPGYALGYNNLGHALAAAGDPAGALEAFTGAVAAEPSSIVALIGLGQANADLRRFDAARDCLQRALVLEPGSLAALTNLAAAEYGDGDLRTAAACYEQVLAAAPHDRDAAVQLAVCYAQLGRCADFHAMAERAIACAPEDRETRSILLFSFGLDPDVSPARAFAAHRDFGALLPARPAPVRAPHAPIRVGYVSGDFRVHACAHFLLPVLQAHDPAAVEVFCYHTLNSNDAVTDAFKAAVPHWRGIRDLDDAAAADRIAADGIDVLVDCAGHTAGNRLGVFALRPAPRAVTWLGYGDTTGLGCIDYRLTDEVLSPAAEGNRWSSETFFRLPHGLFTFDPLSPLPEIAPPPARAAGRITFGSFNAIGKISDRILGVWARALDAVPGSRVLIKDRSLGHEGMRAWFAGRLAAAGIGEHRATMMGRTADKSGHLAAFNHVDICLDTQPYGGATTTCDSLWMGVPVVTMRGDRYVGRQSASILAAAGLADLVAADGDGFAATAAALAADTARLADLRAGLRGRLAATPLGDARFLARDLEAAYRDIVSGRIEPRSGRVI